MPFWYFGSLILTAWLAAATWDRPVAGAAIAATALLAVSIVMLLVEPGRFHRRPHAAGEQPGQQVPAHFRPGQGGAGGGPRCADVLGGDEVGLADQRRCAVAVRVTGPFSARSAIRNSSATSSTPGGSGRADVSDVGVVVNLPRLVPGDALLRKIQEVFTYSHALR
jgi:hypothetical protein